MSDDPENRVIALLRGMRAEMGEQRTLLLALVDQGRRLERRMGEMERRMGELRDDIELMLKAELMGRFAHFETRIERHIDDLAGRVFALESRLPPVA